VASTAFSCKKKHFGETDAFVVIDGLLFFATSSTSPVVRKVIIPSRAQFIFISYYFGATRIRKDWHVQVAMVYGRRSASTD
jgi:hypothetical protein